MLTPRPKPAEGPSPLFHLLTAGRTIRKGSNNRRAVMELQRFLNDYSLAHGGKGGLDADGDFGPRTRSILREFQQANGLDADGEVGMKTKAAIAQLRQAPALDPTKGGMAGTMVPTTREPMGTGNLPQPGYGQLPASPMMVPPMGIPGATPRSVPTQSLPTARDDFPQNVLASPQPWAKR